MGRDCGLDLLRPGASRRGRRRLAFLGRSARGVDPRFDARSIAGHIRDQDAVEGPVVYTGRSRVTRPGTSVKRRWIPLQRWTNWTPRSWASPALRLPFRAMASRAQLVHRLLMLLDDDHVGVVMDRVDLRLKRRRLDVHDVFGRVRVGARTR